MQRDYGADDIRQGTTGNGVRVMLLISMSAAAVALLGAALFM